MNKPGPKPKIEYGPDVLDTLRRLGKIQATVEECASFLNVSERTLQNFFAAHPDAKEAHEDGKRQGLTSLRRLQFELGNACTCPVCCPQFAREWRRERARERGRERRADPTYRERGRERRADPTYRERARERDRRRRRNKMRLRHMVGLENLRSYIDDRNHKSADQRTNDVVR